MRTVDRKVRFRDQDNLDKQSFASADHLSGQRSAWDNLLRCLTPGLLTWLEPGSGMHPPRSGSSFFSLLLIESIIRKPSLFAWDLTAP